MKKTMNTLKVMFAAMFLLLCSAVPAFAATSAGGYSIPAALTIQVGEQKTLKVTEPSGKYANISFQYDPNYVTKSGYSAGAYWGKTGEITFQGKAPGSFTSYVTLDVHSKAGVPNSSYAKYKLECNVTVVKKGTANTAAAVKQTTKTTTKTTVTPSVQKKIALSKISLNRTSVSLNAGEKAALSVTFYPSNTTESKSVTWTSSNPSVASVSSGKVTARKAGTATITAKAGTKSASCRVTVKAKEGYRNVSEAYTLLNSFRTSKSNQWYWNKDNKTKTTVYGLKALKKDIALEKVAKKRAEEQWRQYYANGKQTHDRPNGSKWYTAYPDSLKVVGENLAWGQTTCREVILDGTYGWAETNLKYDKQGHRRNMLDKRFTKVGIACYEKNGKTCWAMSLGK